MAHEACEVRSRGKAREEEEREIHPLPSETAQVEAAVPEKAGRQFPAQKMLKLAGEVEQSTLICWMEWTVAK